MAELNKIRFLLLVSLIIFPAHALDVIFSSADEDFKQKSEISTHIENGRKTYGGALNQLTYRPEPYTSKVIVYIVDRSRFVEIIRNAVRGTRLQIARELSEWRCELILLGIDNFGDDEYYLISGFIDDKIRRIPGHTNVTIETIGENHFDRTYHRTMFDHVLHVEKYEENPRICGGALQARLRDIRRGALTKVGNNDKEVRLRGFHPMVAELKWTVCVENDIYCQYATLLDPKYNLRIRFKARKFCLLIVDGKEYAALTSYGKRSVLKMEMERILYRMTSNNEGLVFLGVFNFDWTEIGIVTQLILKHSKGPDDEVYNVFTYGYGMFNTRYRNVYANDGRNILPQPKSNITDLIKVLMGEEVKERSIKMFYSSYGWKELEMPIKLDNGQYVTAGRFKNYTFPWVNQKIAFIVYDATEKNVPIDIRMVYQSMEELKVSGIYVAVIEAINFGLDDMHIIAEWIDYHRGLYMENSDRDVIDAERIAVLGAGMFDTIFQSKTTTYKTLFNTKKNELKAIRNAVVKSAKTKYVFAAQIDNSNFEVWTYPMNTINGFYEPDLIPDKNMFAITNEKKTLFIITSGHYFYPTATLLVKNREPIYRLRGKIEKYYPNANWSIFLVGLDNFGERDYHLFAELVKLQTNGRPLDEFVCIINHGIGAPSYQYKDTLPLDVDDRPRLRSYINSFFEMICKLSDGTSFY